MRSLLIVALLLGGCGGQSGQEPAKTASSPAPVTAPPVQSAHQRAVTKADETLGIKPGEKLAATIHTSMGDIHCDLWPDKAPVTVTNFVQLAEGTKPWTDPTSGDQRTDSLYDGTVFHRVIDGFMIQGGDPTGTGRGGPGYRFDDEIAPDVHFDQPGILAMANAGPNTNGSQFFITDSEPRWLDGHYNIFGKCDLPVVQKIISQPKKPVSRGKPSEPVNAVKIVHIDIQRG